MTEIKLKSCSSPGIENRYSNLLDLKDFFVGPADYVIIKLPDDFPNYCDHSDIDILCRDRNSFLNHVLAVGKKYQRQGFEIKVDRTNEHLHVDFYPPAAKRLNFRFDLISDFFYEKFEVNPQYSEIVLQSRRRINRGGLEIQVPSLEHDLAIRFLEYIEYVDYRPDKIKHWDYIKKHKCSDFVDVVNRYTDLNISTEQVNGTTNLKVSKKRPAAGASTKNHERFYKMSPTCQIPGLDSVYEQYFGRKTNGCFVEVGAYDGEYVSNTSCLADVGWTGYYIEPVHEYFQRCSTRHAKNKNIIVSQLAIGAETGRVDVNVGGALSTISDVMKRNFESLEWSKSSFSGNKKIRVDQLTLDEYLTSHAVKPGFELLAVDVEGYEWNVFRNFDIEKWHPQMVIVELHDQNDDYLLIREDCKNIVRYFADHNYKAIYKDSTNTIYMLNPSQAHSNRIDYFLIWGHGLAYTKQILEIIRNCKDFEIISIVKKPIGDIGKFVEDIYSCDSVPLKHLINKTRYLLNTPPEIIFILVKNNNPQEMFFGEGSFRHIQCKLIKDVKEQIRNRFNPRNRDGTRSENHVIHASDYESQVKHVLNVLNLPSVEYYTREPNSELDVPFHIEPFDDYTIKQVNIDNLRANILGLGIVQITQTPHYKYVTGDKSAYCDYLARHLGKELIEDHLPEAYDLMIRNFRYDYITHNGRRSIILAELFDGNNYRILDGVHRAAVLKRLGVQTVAIAEPIRNKTPQKPCQPSITALVFSKDRAMQLQATIESLLLHCQDKTIANLVVLFKASSEVHHREYDELKEKFPAVSFVEETDFRQQVLSVVERREYVLFLVDDNIFVKPFSLRDVIAALDSEKNAIGFSLRLGKNTEYCYSLSSPQKLPEFECLNDGILKYNWPGAECDFGYPLEVSSSVYRSNEILHLLNKSKFSNPNTLEAVMYQNRNTFVSTVPFLLTFEKSVTFCNPVNVVQNECKLNKFGTIHSYTSGQLADCLSRGMAIDVGKYVGFTPDSAHQEVELHFTPAERAIPGTQMTSAGCELKPKFSIVMANYNNGRFIAQAIDSVISQTLKDWELIIVDDCSTDDSIDVIKHYLTDDRIRLIRRDANKGYVAALKTAIADVRSDTFGVLDSDDCLAAHAVETMYRHHIHSPDCGFIYSQFIHCDENLRSKQLGFCRVIPAGKTTLDMQAVSHFKTFKLRDYLKTSGFDESMRYAEDKDIIYKMEEVTQLKFVDDCLYLYRDLPHSQSHDARKAAIGLESVKRAKSAALQRRNQTHKATAFLTSIGQSGSRPKVAFVSTTDKRGGAAKVAWMLKEGLAANGFQTKMFVRDKFSDDADVLKISSSGLDRAKELERQGLLYYDIKSTLLLAHNRDFTGCDVFHFHNLHGGYFNPFALAGLSRLKPSVWTLHDMQAITGHCAHSFDCNKWQTGCGNCPNLKTYPAINIDQTQRMLEDKRRIYAESNVEIIVPSQWLKDIVAKSILKDKKVHLIYNGIDEQIYRPYDKSAVRRQLKLTEDAIVIGFASPKGLVEQFKGGDYILEAYNYFVSKYPNLYFLCVGGKAENAPTERFIQIPFVTDETSLAQIYCAADMFMYPSVADNCPLIVLELMGCGVPIVSFEVGGVPELIEHGKTGFLAPYKNVGELIHLTEQLVLDEAGRRRFGQAAIERLRERFTLDRMIDNHIRLYESLTQKRLSGQSEQGDEKPVVSTGQASKQNRYLVSAIVSTYNSEKFIRGCLEDLENQTIADKLEIIVVNSGSEQNEELVVKEFQKRYSNIVYVKTDEREGLYSAWNRAVNIASGQFLTSANTDDRHRKDAFEVMADTLLKNTDVALVYGDQIVTDTPNPTFENHRVIELAKRPEFSKERLLFGCCVGSQPMWRKSLHDELGGFDETLTCAADWDFWLKVAGRYSFKHIPEFLGLYFYNTEGIEHGRRIHGLYERYVVGRRYNKQYMSSIPLYEARGNPLVSIVMAAYNAAGYIARAIESVLIQNYRNFELIVVDDGSTDRTAEIVRGFKNEPIKYFYKENGGVSSARNYALKKAGGSFVVILDSDDMMTLDFIARHLRVFEQNPETDLVYCDDCFIDENDKPIRVMSRPEYSDQKALVSDLFRYGWAILPFRTCIRKSVFDKIGLYDERLIMSEDYDMVRRFVSQGLRMRHLPAALYLRHPTANSLSRSFNAAKAKGHFEVVRKFTETFTAEQLFPGVRWENLPAEQKSLLAKCKAALVYIGIGEQYLASNAQDFAETAFDMACAQLDDCCKIEPANHQVRNLREKCQFIRDKRLSNTGRNIYQQV
jgi:FkbM family methyltransferase